MGAGIMDEFSTKLVEESAKELARPVAETAGNLTLPISETMGKTFSDFWDLILGSHVSLAREKQKLRQIDKLDNYKQSIQSKVEAIPEERLVEAPLHVVGPAIEAAKFYVENDELSEMFSNLISSAFDAEKVKTVHPSFTEVIKQMSPLDALNLNVFKVSDLQPICDVIIRSGNDGSYVPIINNYFIGHPSEEFDAKLHSTSIINLVRLGLVELERVELTNKEAYNKFYEDAFYQDLIASYDVVTETNIFGENTKFELLKKIVRLTSFGRDFINTVIKQ